MEITEIRVKIVDETHMRLRAFCSITFDDAFVIRDLKILDGTHGLFVAMPSRKVMTHCPKCRHKNAIHSKYCNQCGVSLKTESAEPGENTSGKVYMDIVHPINSECREQIHKKVLEAYEQEKIRARQPDYISTYDDLSDIE
ncbi:MAG: septation protein SpoVG family protein [Thermoguttaceae bacterium]|nr:septation protein SpoVG family protein [Thermoguttaceae bacterium]